MKKPPSTPATAGDNEDFVRLVEIAGQDPEFCRQLTAILSLDEFHRQSLINSWIEQLRLNHAPSQIIDAISCLSSSQIASRLLTFLQSDQAR